MRLPGVWLPVGSCASPSLGGGLTLGEPNGTTDSGQTTTGDVILVPTVPEPGTPDGGGPLPTPQPVYVSVLQIRIGAVPNPNKKVKPVIYSGPGDAKKKVVSGQEIIITAAMANTTQDIELTVPAGLIPGETYYIGIQTNGGVVFLTDPTAGSIAYAGVYADGPANTLTGETKGAGRANVYARGNYIVPAHAVLAISGAPGTTGMVGVAYSFTPTVAGGIAAYAFSLHAGTLPDGLTLDADFGTISGTPTTAETQNGIVLRVTDAIGGASDLASFNLAITAGDAGILAAGFVTMAGATPTLNKGKNATNASIVRTGTGKFTITFTAPVPISTYGLIAFARAVDGAADGLMVMSADLANGNYSTTAVDVTCCTGAGVLTDPKYWGFVVFDPATLADADYLTAVLYTVSGSTATIQKQKNVASVVQNVALGTPGFYTIAYTGALADASYSTFECGQFPVGAPDQNPRISPDAYSGAADNRYTTALQDNSFYNASGGQQAPLKGGLLIKNADADVPGQLAAVRFTVSGGVATIVKQTNVASVVQQATGVYRVTFTSALADAQYVVLTGAKPPNSGVSGTGRIGGPNANTTSSRGNFSTASVDITLGGPSGTPAEPDWVDVWVLNPALM